jgi:hypothetical protein
LEVSANFFNQSRIISGMAGLFGPPLFSPAWSLESEKAHQQPTDLLPPPSHHIRPLRGAAHSVGQEAGLAHVVQLRVWPLCACPLRYLGKKNQRI